jgi:amino acid transporter
MNPQRAPQWIGNAHLSGRTAAKALYFIAVWIGVGVMLYAALVAFLSWMPKSWTRFVDGERQWIAEGIGTMVGFFGSVFFLSGMTSVAKKMQDGARQIAALTAEVEQLRKQVPKPGWL